MFFSRRACIWAMPVLAISAVSRADDLDKAIQELVQAHSNTKSYRANVKSREHLIFDAGNELDSKVSGTVAWMRKGDKLLYRADSEDSSVQKVKGLETPTHAKKTMVCDGEYFYTYIEVMGEKQAAKQLPSPILGADARKILGELKADYNLKLASEESWGDAPCYVIEATPKREDASEHMAKAQYYFRKDTGTAVRTLGFDVKGNKSYTIEHFDVERNPELDPEDFTFEVPEGVQLQDLTNP